MWGLDGVPETSRRCNLDGCTAQTEVAPGGSNKSHCEDRRVREPRASGWSGRKGGSSPFNVGLSSSLWAACILCTNRNDFNTGEADLILSPPEGGPLAGTGCPSPGGIGVAGAEGLSLRPEVLSQAATMSWKQLLVLLWHLNGAISYDIPEVLYELLPSLAPSKEIL